MGWTPLFLKAEPHRMGTAWLPRVTVRMARWRSSGVISSSPRYFSMIVSSWLDTTSMSWWWASSAAALRSAGISSSVHSSPIPSSQTRARMWTRSTTPRKPPSAPMGSCTTATVASRRSLIMSTHWSKLAPVRSILLMKQIRGTAYLSACRHTVSVWGSTPATASKTATAPSRTRRERSTSTVKSTWPGVSMMLITVSRHIQVVAAEVMVMPRSCSWGIQSMVAAPSWTSPIL